MHSSKARYAIEDEESLDRAPTKVFARQDLGEGVRRSVSTLSSIVGGIAEVGSNALRMMNDNLFYITDQLAEFAAPSDLSSTALKSQIGQKIKCGLGYLCTEKDIDDLFYALDRDGSGKLSMDEMCELAQVIFGEVDNSMKQLISMAGEDHLLDPQEFRIVMHLVIQMADSREVTEIGVPKDDFYGFLKHEIDLKQGCETLPLTVLLFMSFWSAIVNHFRNQAMNRFRLVVEEEVAMPEFKRYQSWATNHTLFFDWMHEELLPTVFVYPPYPGRFQGVIQVLGGIQLDVLRAYPGRCRDRWGLGGDAVDGVLHVYEPEARCRGRAYRETQWLWLGAGVQAAHEDLLIMHNTSSLNTTWIDAYTSEFGVRFLTYNANVGLLGMAHLNYKIASSGSITSSYSTQGTIVDPFGAGGTFEFSSWWIIFVDIVFVAVIGLSLLNESRTIRRICQGNEPVMIKIFSYLSFWVVIDWINIVSSINFAAQAAFLYGFRLPVLLETIAGAPALVFNKTHLGAGPGAVTPSRERFGEALEAKGSSLTSYAASFDEAVEQFESIDALWDSLRFWASCFSATMMVRFFKAFRPNPRMNRVARTLVMAWSDLMHFVIVFAAVFSCFAILGHMSFGSSVQDFSTVPSAFNGLFLSVLGEFEFWSLLDAAGFVTGSVYFWVFQGLVFCLIINMLIAIVIDRYAQVKLMLSGQETFWAQLAELFESYRKRGKGGEHLYDPERFLLGCFKSPLIQRMKGTDVLTTAVLVEELACSEKAADEALGLAEQHLVEQSGAVNPSIPDALHVVVGVDRKVSTMIQDQNLMTGKMMKFVTARKAPPKGLMAKGRIDVNLCERLVEECPVPEWQLRRMRNLEKRRSLYRPDRVEDRKTRVRKTAIMDRVPEPLALEDLSGKAAAAVAQRHSDAALAEAGWSEQAIVALRAGEVRSDGNADARRAWRARKRRTRAANATGATVSF